MEIVITHTNADFDAYASMVAVGKLHPQAKASFPGAMEENLRLFLHDHPSPIEIIRSKNLDLSQISHLFLVDTKLSSKIGVFSALTGSPACRTTVYDHHAKLP
ncbi:MAG: bifunctional oligoribonuclease/PAP phosphatase NrnA [bacterium]